MKTHEGEHDELRFVPAEFTPTYREMLGKVDFHIHHTTWRSRIYFYMSSLVMWGAPILSAVVTAFGFEDESVKLPFYISGIVTVVTVLNAIIRSHEHLFFAERYSNKFLAFHTHMQRVIEKAHVEEQDPKARAHHYGLILDSLNEELSRLIEEFNIGPRKKEQSSPEV